VRIIGNIIWLLFGGIVLALGIPFGVQCFKIGALVLWPFGREVQIGKSF